MLCKICLTGMFLLQYLHENLNPSCTALLFRARFSFDVAWWLHCPQWYLTPSCNALSCWARLPFVVARWLHCPQGYLTPSCTALLCWAKSPFDVARWKGNLTPSRTTILCLPRFPLMLLDSWIARKETWLLHVLSFCVLLNSSYVMNTHDFVICNLIFTMTSV